MDSVRAKFTRAKKYANEAKSLCDLIADNTKADIRTSTDSDPTILEIYLAEDVKIPFELGTIIGDCLGNIRSAFDHLAWKLVILDGGKPNRYTQFPIYSIRPNNGINGLIKPSIRNQDILIALEASQPYSNANGYENDQLWFVNEMCKIDKHRFPILDVAVVDIEKTFWTLPNGIESPSVKVSRMPIQNGSRLATFDFHGIEVPKDFIAQVPIAVIINDAGKRWSDKQNAGSFMLGLTDILRNRVQELFYEFFPNEAPLWLPYNT